MLPYKDKIRIQHMLDHATEAISMALDKNRSDLNDHRMLELSLVRLIEIIGEAATHVESETKEKYDTIAWPHIVGMRNRLIHGYDAVDLDVLWDTITDDLPPLIEELQKILLSQQKND